MPEVTKGNKSLPLVTSVAEYPFWSIISPANLDFQFSCNTMNAGRNLYGSPKIDDLNYMSKSLMRHISAADLIATDNTQCSQYETFDDFRNNLS